MACKCPEKKPNPSTPCLDANEESFRQAYVKLNQAYIQLSAQKIELEKQIKTILEGKNG